MHTNKAARLIVGSTIGQLRPGASRTPALTELPQ